MSEPINDGGPAFPLPDVYHSNGEIQRWAGMTLRDWLAGQALASLNYPLTALHDIDAAYLREATHCYRMADAMLKARES